MKVDFLQTTRYIYNRTTLTYYKKEDKYGYPYNLTEKYDEDRYSDAYKYDYTRVTARELTELE